MADWQAAYALHAPAIRGYLRRRLPQAAEAEDLCQETFARVLERQVQLRDPKRVRSYLMQTAHNLLVNHLRRPRVVQLAGDVAPDRSLEELAGAVEEPSELELHELEERLGRALAKLDERQREIFHRAVLRREGYAAIASDLGVAVSTIKVSVFRTRRQLAATLHSEEVNDGSL